MAVLMSMPMLMVAGPVCRRGGRRTVRGRRQGSVANSSSSSGAGGVWIDRQNYGEQRQ